MSANFDDVIRLLEQVRTDVQNAIANVKVNANQVQLKTVSDLTEDLGLLQMGEFRSGNGLDIGYGFTGMRMSGIPMSYDLGNGETWNLVGVYEDTLKAGINAVTGLLYATDATISGTITASAGAIGGWTISATQIYSGSFILDSAVPALRIGATDYMTGIGLFLGISGGQFKMHLGDPDYNHLTWDGSALQIVGGLTAVSGTIGGWAINATTITDTAGMVGLSSEVTGSDDIRIWAGHTVPGSAPFYVTEAGYLYATNVNITGAIAATSGTIGGWVIDSFGISKVTANIGVIISSSGASIELGDVSGTHIELDGANKHIRSSNYVAGASGFNIDSDTGDAEFNNVTMRGIMHTAVFEKDVISVVGGDVLILPGDALAVDMTAADNSTLTIEGTETFAVGDILRMKDGVDDEWLEVTNAASAPTYVVTRDKAGSYGANSNPAWKRGQAVTNYMQSGDGGLLLQSGATPALYLFNHAGSPWSTITNEVTLDETGITAGEGVVKLNSLGTYVIATTSADDARSYKFQNVGGDVLSRITHYDDAETEGFEIKLNPIASKISWFNVKSESPSGYDAILVMSAYDSTTLTQIHLSTLDKQIVVQASDEETATFDANGMLLSGVNPRVDILTNTGEMVLGDSSGVGILNYTAAAAGSNLLLTNPGFEGGNTNGWGTAGTIAASTAEKHTGSYSCKLSDGAVYTATANLALVTAGLEYTCKVWVNPAAGAPSRYYVEVLWYKADNTYLSATVISTVVSYSNWWILYFKNITAPATAGKAAIRVRLYGASPHFVYVDDASIQLNSGASSIYTNSNFVLQDGPQGGTYWGVAWWNSTTDEWVSEIATYYLDYSSYTQQILSLDVPHLTAADREIIRFQVGWESPQTKTLMAMVIDNGDTSAGGPTLPNITMTTSAVSNTPFYMDASTGITQIQGQKSLNDDVAFSFVPNTATGALLLYAGNNTGHYAWVFYNANAASAPVAYVVGGNIALGNVALTNGTTNGTDGKININCAGDGKIYVKNRFGSGLVMRIFLI